uniref:Uncharacterized protein n=1 Tax=Tanacetum cinerariifolium TaxID=118510 RepID=A0A6L2NF56_TANCI|nr:hypothetical protein [Tanacetum cinerariifolium]
MITTPSHAYTTLQRLATMGDANPIRTLRDYSKPSHEGYRNTIKLPEGNNVVPLRSDTIRGSDPEMPVKEAEKENEAENGAKNEPIKKAEREEAMEAPNSQPVGGLKHMTALVDQGSDINIMPLSTYMKLTKERPAEMDIRLSLASHSYIYPLGIAYDVLVDVVGNTILDEAKVVIKFDKGTITLRSGKSKISVYRIPESLSNIEKGIKNDIEPVAPTMTMNRLVLEWEERIKLHQEKEMEFDQWRSKKFKNKHPTLIKVKGEMNEGEFMSRFEKEILLGDGSESGGLYMFHVDWEIIMDQLSDTAEERPFDCSHTASSMDKDIFFEDNVLVFQNTQVPTYDSSNRTKLDKPDVVNTRKSSKVSKFLDKLNDYVLDDKVKYALIKHMHSPLQSHFEDALRVLRYLKSAPGAVSWTSKKQATLLRSSGEADIDLWTQQHVSSAIQIASNLVMHEKTKHFDIDVHLIREKLASGLIKTVIVDSEDQTDDILTKGLRSFQHNALCSKLTLKNLSSL